MSHQEIATRAGVNLADIESLLSGKTTANVANRLGGVSQMDVDGFVLGSATATMTKRLGLQTQNAAKELALAAGNKGAIGIVLGLLIARW